MVASAGLAACKVDCDSLACAEGALVVVAMVLVAKVTAAGAAAAAAKVEAARAEAATAGVAWEEAGGARVVVVTAMVDAVVEPLAGEELQVVVMGVVPVVRVVLVMVGAPLAGLMAVDSTGWVEGYEARAVDLLAEAAGLAAAMAEVTAGEGVAMVMAAVGKAALVAQEGIWAVPSAREDMAVGATEREVGVKGVGAKVEGMGGETVVAETAVACLVPVMVAVQSVVETRVVA